MKNLISPCFLFNICSWCFGTRGINFLQPARRWLRCILSALVTRSCIVELKQMKEKPPQCNARLVCVATLKVQSQNWQWPSEDRGTPAGMQPSGITGRERQRIRLPFSCCFLQTRAASTGNTEVSDSSLFQKSIRLKFHVRNFRWPGFFNCVSLLLRDFQLRVWAIRVGRTWNFESQKKWEEGKLVLTSWFLLCVCISY